MGHRQWQIRLKELNQQIHFRLHGNEWVFMWAPYFGVSAYKKHNTVVIIKMGIYIHSTYFLWVPILGGIHTCITLYACVAVPDRNRILFCRVFRVLHQV